MYPPSKTPPHKYPPNKLHPAQIQHNDEIDTILRRQSKAEYKRRAQKIHQAKIHEKQPIHEHHKKATAHFLVHNEGQEEHAILKTQTQARLARVDKKSADIEEELEAKWEVVKNGTTWEEVDVSDWGASFKYLTNTRYFEIYYTVSRRHANCHSRS